MYEKKNKTLKVLVAVLSVVLVMCLTVAGTLAYLQDKTETVINTFTSSDVSITLTETKPANKTAKMVPGADIEKDPKVNVLDGSEDCYVYVKIEKSANFDTYMTYEVDTTVWTQVETGDNYVVYGREATANQSYDILKDNKVSVNPTVTKADMQLIDGVIVEGVTEQSAPTLTFTAYAIQKSELKNDDAVVNTLEGAWALVTK